MKKGNIVVAYLLHYVDGMLIVAGTSPEVQKIKDELESEIYMKDLGDAKWILGMDIIRNKWEEVAADLKILYQQSFEKISNGSKQTDLCASTTIV